MKIENLKIFLVAAQSGSIRKAADLLFVSPQNLSFIIRNLEQELKVQLLQVRLRIHMEELPLL